MMATAQPVNRLFDTHAAEILSTSVLELVSDAAILENRKALRNDNSFNQKEPHSTLPLPLVMD